MTIKDVGLLLALISFVLAVANLAWSIQRERSTRKRKKAWASPEDALADVMVHSLRDAPAGDTAKLLPLPVRCSIEMGDLCNHCSGKGMLFAFEQMSPTNGTLADWPKWNENVVVIPAGWKITRCPQCAGFGRDFDVGVVEEEAK